MEFGKTIGTACTSFIITNIDDIFVLVTFFAESSTSATLTPLRIALGQYIGFTIIVGISMIGFGLALVLPAEPIGFLGLLPILLGLWKGFDIVFPDREEEDDGLEEDNGRKSKIASVKSVLKVAGITLMNGGDNIGTYTPLFSQAKGAEIAVYIVTHILRVAERYAHLVIPFLYVGLGIFITVKSECYPWSIGHIDRDIASHPGKIIMGVVTAVLLAGAIGVMVWFQLRGMPRKPASDTAGDDVDAEIGDDATIVEQTATKDSEQSQLQVSKESPQHPLDEPKSQHEPTGLST
ncbi:unnamed protein product [Periconia digitata]|uniref:Cadmium resistance transporter n=1 Tax=Periconia digitata TaxID=1303443 RepID=A0A9W4XIJ6_9PLEO|nr:unnamed protein product [Periconia digitata]